MARKLQPHLTSAEREGEPGAIRLALFTTLVSERPEAAAELLAKAKITDIRRNPDELADDVTLPFSERVYRAVGSLIHHNDDLSIEADVETDDAGQRAIAELRTRQQDENLPTRQAVLLRRVCMLGAFATEYAGWSAGNEATSMPAVAHSLPEAA